MALVGKSTPARFWWAFFFCGLAAVRLQAAAPAKPPELAQIGLPDAGEARQILDQFRRSGIPGEYFLEFELHGLPRRGDEVVFKGRLWAGRNTEGAITRIELQDAGGKIRRFLVQNGERARLWRFDAAGVKQLGAAESFEPLIAGLEITAFDLQMPFLYWPNAKVERIARIRGRPTNVFVFPAPPEVAAANHELAAVRAYLDTQYNAFLQIEHLGAKGLLKSVILVDLKKVGEQWIPKSLDVRNEVTRDKTRFLIIGAALNLELATAVFAPAALAESIPPPTNKVVSVAP